MSRFAPGDRVVALPDTEWDTDMDADLTESDRDFLRLHGHHGRVVDGCDKPDCDWTHVVWVGVHDGRPPEPTNWTHGHVWHMGDDEIEHAD